MSLRDDHQKSRESAHKAEVSRLTRRIEQLSVALESARNTRPLKPIKPAAPRRLTGDIVRFLIPDSHGSSQDPQAVGAMLADLKLLNPDEVVLLGDHVDCGGFLAQHHTLGYVAQTEYSYEDDIKHANAFLDAVQTAAPKAEIFYLEGNHEMRIEKWAVNETLRNQRDSEMLRRLLAPEFVLKLKERGIKYYRQSEKYFGLSLPGTIKLGKNYMTHGFSTAKHAAAVHLAKIGGNITYGHTHRADAATTELTNIGIIAAYSPGCLCLKQPLWQHTNPTGWTQGVGVQLVDRRSKNFLQLNIPIVDGVSMMKPLLNHGAKN